MPQSGLCRELQKAMHVAYLQIHSSATEILALPNPTARQCRHNAKSDIVFCRVNTQGSTHHPAEPPSCFPYPFPRLPRCCAPLACCRGSVGRSPSHLPSQPNSSHLVRFSTPSHKFQHIPDFQHPHTNSNTCTINRMRCLQWPAVGVL